MCGILISKNLVSSEESFKNLLLTQIKRGPDAQNIEKVDDIYLGHTRLTIIDKDKKADQPFWDTEGRYLIVYNGEIYNYLELKEELLRVGYFFKTNSDTEVLLNWFIHKGVEGFKDLNGMFAFAIYDTVKKSIIMARDRFGIKPLYYHKNESGTIISSQVSTLKPFATKKSRKAKILFSGLGHIPEPFNLYEDINNLPPGYFAKYEDENLTFGQFASVFKGGKNQKSFLTPQTFKNILKRFLRADVEIGTLLSGGIDSSILTANICKMKKKLRSISVNFNFGNLSERKKQEIFLEKFPHTNISTNISFNQFTGYKKEYEELTEQPSVDGLNSYIATKVAKKNDIKVLISGLGGDELFYGYPSFQSYKKIKLLSYILPGFALKFLPKKFLRLEYAKLDPVIGSYFTQRSINSPTEISQLLAINIQEVRETLQEYFSYISRKVDLRDKNLVSKLEIGEYMKNQLLRDTDVYSMSNSVEVRIPFLDNDLVASVINLPPKQKRTSPPKGYLLKNSEEELPKELIYEKKIGFEVPFSYYYNMKSPDKPHYEHWAKSRIKDILSKYDSQ